MTVQLYQNTLIEPQEWILWPSDCVIFPKLEVLFEKIKLTQLFFVNCYRLSSKDFQNLQFPETLIQLSLCEEQTQMRVRENPSSSQLDAKGLQNCVTRCPSLQFLRLGNCSNLTIEDIAKASLPSTLKTLDLRFFEINEQALRQIISHCSNLQTITVAAKFRKIVKNITSPAFFELVYL